MKRYIAPKESDSADLLDVFLYIHTYESHTWARYFVIFMMFLVFLHILYKAIYFIHVCKTSLLCHMHACCLLCSKGPGQLVELKDCYISVMLPVQFECGAGTLQNGKVFKAFSPTCTHL